MDPIVTGKTHMARGATAWPGGVLITPPPIGERSIVMSVSVCLCACLSVLEHIFRTTRPILTKFLRMLPMAVVRFACGGVLIRYVLPVLWITPYIFAHKLRLLDVAAQLERSARVALGLAINCAQQYQLQANGRTPTGLIFGCLK